MMAFKDSNFDICEAAFQLACDAQDNRFKASLPIKKSTLLCESLVTSEVPGKSGAEGKYSVSEDSILNLGCFTRGKWSINGNSVTYYPNFMHAETPIQVFSLY